MAPWKNRVKDSSSHKQSFAQRWRDNLPEFTYGNLSFKLYRSLKIYLWNSKQFLGGGGGGGGMPPDPPTNIVLHIYVQVRLLLVSFALGLLSVHNEMQTWREGLILRCTYAGLHFGSQKNLPSGCFSKSLYWYRPVSRPPASLGTGRCTIRGW